MALYMLASLLFCFVTQSSSTHHWLDTTRKVITSLPEVALGNWKFLLAMNSDLYGIEMRFTLSLNTTVHLLTKASNYKQKTTMYTALPETDESWDFAIAPNNDIFCIHGTNSRKIEIHVLSAQHQYRVFALYTVTTLDTIYDPEYYDFQVSANRDLYVLKKEGRHNVEVHILSTAHRYSSYSRTIVTAFPKVGPNFKLLVHPETNDLIIIKMQSNNHRRIHVDVLSKTSDYQEILHEAASGFHEVDVDSIIVGIAPNWDVYVIRSLDTRSGNAELEISH